MSSLTNDPLHQNKGEDVTTTHPVHHQQAATHAEPRTDTTTHGISAGDPHDSSYTTGHNYALGGNNRGTDGPHQSDLANKADPRVDSDRDHSKNMGANPHGTADTGRHEAFHGTNEPRTTEMASRTEGPHSSDVKNKLDPRVDSDRDGSKTIGGDREGSRNAGVGPQCTSTTKDDHGHRTAGLAAGAATGAAAGTGAVAAAGHHHDSANRGHDSAARKTDGPHKSDLANKLDPRVDSDRDHSKNLGANPQGTATTGNTNITGSHSTTGTTGTTGTTAGVTGVAGGHGTGTKGAPDGTYGHHNSRVANAADPRIDSDRDGSHGAHTRSRTGAHEVTVGGTHGTGPAPHTAGPHKSDLLNKLDPRVDSNLDGSKTVGGDKTHARSSVSAAEEDATDAAQAPPPSVLQKHVGGMTMHHDFSNHGGERRHSVSHQKQHRRL